MSSYQTAGTQELALVLVHPVKHSPHLLVYNAEELMRDNFTSSLMRVLIAFPRPSSPQKIDEKKHIVATTYSRDNETSSRPEM